jgi:competence protein ComEC
MTGGSATVLRASVMALLVLLAKATGRTYDVIRALLLAGLFMLIQNPKVLVFDLSFQLSFLSTVALIFVSPIIEKKMTFITEKYKLRELIVATVATQIFVLPFIFYKMGMISLVALPVNLLILPFIPAVMLFGFITGILGFISSLLAWPFALITSGVLTYQLKVIDIFAHLPFSSLNIANFPLSLVVLIYLLFFVIIWKQSRFWPEK